MIAESNKNQLLIKLKALAESGVGGEKENAQKLLEKYMAKYGITEKDLETERTECREFKFSGQRQRQLLVQIAYKVLNNMNSFYTFHPNGRKLTSILGIECTKAQAVEIDFLFDFYKRLYEKDEELFFEAFVQKHQLFGVRSDKDENKPIDYERIMRMAQIICGLSDETPTRQIQGK